MTAKNPKDLLLKLMDDLLKYAMTAPELVVDDKAPEAQEYVTARNKLYADVAPVHVLQRFLRDAKAYLDVPLPPGHETHPQYEQAIQARSDLAMALQEAQNTIDSHNQA